MSTTTASEESVSTRIPDIKPGVASLESQISVSVIFTSPNRTLKALEKARLLAEHIGAHVDVVAVQIVPFPLPLDEPPVPFEFVIRRFEELTKQYVEKIRISKYVCRDPLTAFRRILKSNSLVVMGVGKKRWRPTRDERLAVKLRRAGYEVILVETE